MAFVLDSSGNITIILKSHLGGEGRGRGGVTNSLGEFGELESNFQVILSFGSIPVSGRC